MRQVTIPRYGPPDVLMLREAPEPPLTVGTVRIAVEAIGVNFADLMARQGLYPDCPPLPAVVGFEVAGRIEAVSPEVTDLALGQAVVAMTRFGGYADTVVVPAAQVLPLPPEMPIPVAAALPVNYLTAYVMLYICGNLRPGERVLVHGAGGGVGLAAVQLCRRRQAVIYGTASAAKHAFLRQQGVHACFDPGHEDVTARLRDLTGGRGLDIVLDPLGGSSFAQSYRLLAPLGRLIVYGASRMSSGRGRRPWRALWHLLRMPWFHPIQLMNQNRAVIGVHLGHLWDQAALLRSAMGVLLDLYQQQQISPIIAGTFRMHEAAAAHRFLQERRNIGKVLLSTADHATSSAEEDAP